MKIINLTKGNYTIVDDSDYNYLSKYKWHVCKGYAVRTTSINPRTTEYMHRVIMNNPNADVDHRDGNTLNNRRENLRVCTASQNLMNSTRKKGYKGINLEKETNLWRARITVQGKTKHIGRYLSKEEAAHAYNQAANKLHGEFARLNIL